jgi:hypothetical protein
VFEVMSIYEEAIGLKEIKEAQQFVLEVNKKKKKNQFLSFFFAFCSKSMPCLSYMLMSYVVNLIKILK